MPEIGKNQLIIAAVVVVVLLVGLAAFLNGSGGASMRQEVPVNVDLIRLSEIEYKSAFEDYISAAAAPRDPLSVDSKPVKWAPTRGFEKLSWQPKQAEVYGSYTVNAKVDGFTVIGVCDVDDDRTQARFQATLGEEAKMLTDESIY